MNLLFLSEATGWTGGANQIWLTSQRLIQRGHRVAVACKANFELSRRLLASGVEVIPFSIRQDYDVIGAIRLVRLAEDFNAALIHAHHPRAHALAVLASYLGLARPVIVTRRVIFPIRRNPFSLFKYRSSKVTRYIAVCRAAADELNAVGVERSRISIVPSGVEMDRWEAVRQARPLLRDRRPFIVTMIGHYAAFKGHEVLLRAIPHVRRRIPEARFRIVGRDTEKLREEIESQGVGDRVEILGECRDVPGILEQTHLCVMPSLSEGIGMALIEAQAGLVPVVASAVGGLPDVVEKDRTGLLVRSGDPRELGDAIVRQLEFPKRAEAMAALGLERVNKLFAIDSVVDRLEAIYRETAA